MIQTQSYGAEARGGACRSEIIASDRFIYDLSITQPEFGVIMSFQAYNRHIDRVKTGGFIIIDSSIVKEIERRGGKARQDITIYEIPAIRMTSEKMGNSIVANTILLGFLLRKLDIVKLDSAKNAVSSETNAQMRDINMKALEAGWKRVCH